MFLQGQEEESVAVVIIDSLEHLALLMHRRREDVVREAFQAVMDIWVVFLLLWTIVKPMLNRGFQLLVQHHRELLLCFGTVLVSYDYEV